MSSTFVPGYDDELQAKDIGGTESRVMRLPAGFSESRPRDTKGGGPGLKIVPWIDAGTGSPRWVRGDAKLGAVSKEQYYIPNLLAVQEIFVNPMTNLEAQKAVRLFARPRNINECGIAKLRAAGLRVILEYQQFDGTGYVYKNANKGSYNLGDEKRKTEDITVGLHHGSLKYLLPAVVYAEADEYANRRLKENGPFNAIVTLPGTAKDGFEKIVFDVVDAKAQDPAQNLQDLVHPGYLAMRFSNPTLYAQTAGYVHAIDFTYCRSSGTALSHYDVAVDRNNPVIMYPEKLQQLNFDLKSCIIFGTPEEQVRAVLDAAVDPLWRAFVVLCCRYSPEPEFHALVESEDVEKLFAAASAGAGARTNTQAAGGMPSGAGSQVIAPNMGNSMFQAPAQQAAPQHAAPVQPAPAQFTPPAAGAPSQPMYQQAAAPQYTPPVAAVPQAAPVPQQFATPAVTPAAPQVAPAPQQFAPPAAPQYQAAPVPQQFAPPAANIPLPAGTAPVIDATAATNSVAAQLEALRQNTTPQQ